MMNPLYGQPLPPAADVFNEPEKEAYKNRRPETRYFAVRGSAKRRIDVIALRLVGYLLIHSALFSAEAHEAMERAIASCVRELDEVATRFRLCEHGRFYVNHLIGPSELSLPSQSYLR